VGSHVVAVGTGGRLLWKIQLPTPQQDYLASNGIVYQLILRWPPDASNQQPYTWVDLTATRGRDEKSLWSTHFQF
jgi:hypothetical protein